MSFYDYASHFTASEQHYREKAALVAEETKFDLITSATFMLYLLPNFAFPPNRKNVSLNFHSSNSFKTPNWLANGAVRFGWVEGKKY